MSRLLRKKRDKKAWKGKKPHHAVSYPKQIKYKNYGFVFSFAEDGVLFFSLVDRFSVGTWVAIAEKFAASSSQRQVQTISSEVVIKNGTVRFRFLLLPLD